MKYQTLNEITYGKLQIKSINYCALFLTLNFEYLGKYLTEHSNSKFTITFWTSCMLNQIQNQVLNNLYKNSQSDIEHPVCTFCIHVTGIRSQAVNMNSVYNSE